MREIISDIGDLIKDYEEIIKSIKILEKELKKDLEFDYKNVYIKDVLATKETYYLDYTQVFKYWKEWDRLIEYFQIKEKDNWHFEQLTNSLKDRCFRTIYELEKIINELKIISEKEIELLYR